jgi:16S rRNA (guanine527-N7)-methyltransferase
MIPELERDLMAALERPHRLGTIGGVLEEQLAHSASFSSVLGQLFPDETQPPQSGLDLGTGGGLPGVVLASLWPATQWTLVDMRSARAAEVEHTVLRLQLQSRVDVVASEAQFLGHDDAHREQYDIVVARSFGAPSIAAECAAGLVAVGGWFVVSEPPQDANDPEDDRWDVTSLNHLGFAGPVVHDVDGRRFASLRKQERCPQAIPRIPPRGNRGWYRPKP